MPAYEIDQPVAVLTRSRHFETLDVFGPTIEMLLAPDGPDDALCILRGTIPPGGTIPMHSHADAETFLPVSGAFEGLTASRNEYKWVSLAAGDMFVVPGGAKHAFRNRSAAPAVTIIVTTARMGRFFKEVGRPTPVAGRPAMPPSDADVAHFIETAHRYGYWNATMAENAGIGLPLPPTPGGDVRPETGCPASSSERAWG